MFSNPEVQRLVRVYRQYKETGDRQTQWSMANAGNRAIIEERTRVLKQMLSEAGFLPLTDRRILDVGCGCGSALARLTEWGALPCNLYGIDLLPDRVEAAKQIFPEMHFRHGNAEQLEFTDAAFDLVLLYTVFTSILDDGMARNVAREVSRVLKPGGAVVWYDFRYNNPRNRNVRAMTQDRIRAFFPGLELQLRTVTLLPPIARRLGRTTPVLYPALARIRCLRSHYAGLLVKTE